jgi:two-component system alkaline phosphatase synthesis response regulator PhoP
VSKILVADDEEELLELIKLSLEGAGHDVTTAKNGKQATEKARLAPYDIIILDVMMPIMDGYHAAREIVQDRNAPPILLLTSRDFDQDQSAIKGSGATAFLSKPFEVPELLETVRGLVAGR